MVFTVNYFVLNFGNVGSDTFINEKIKDTLPKIAKKLSIDIGETVYYRVIE